ncbi:MAG: hypothetical protein M1827_005712 [Pycnora praestabilis]|nr:MAG: hypothetical protein M1827_005712 [Pycnora praestabilis]
MQSSDDEDLKQAIALSLQCESHEHTETADIEDDPAPKLESAEFMKTKTAEGHKTRKSPNRRFVMDNGLTDLDVCSNTGQPRNQGPDDFETRSLTQKQPLEASGIFGLDRRSDEQARLTRKRRTPISPPPLGDRRAMKVSKSVAPPLIDLTTTREEAGMSDKLGLPNSLNTERATKGGVPSTFRKQGAGEEQRQLCMPSLEYPKGATKKTWAFGQPRDEDIKIEEVLRRRDLDIAVLSSFQWDVEWLLQKLDIPRTKLILVMQAKDEETKIQYHFLRLVVPSANLVPYDWGETGVMENTVFLIDLPRYPNEQKAPSKNLTTFGEDLMYFLKAMGLQEDVIQGVLKFDFSETKPLAFVHTIGGSHTGDHWKRTGYCGLGRAVQALGLSTRDAIDIDFVTSSIGSINEDFLKTVYLAAQGDDGLIEYNWRTNKSTRAKKSDVEDAVGYDGVLSDRLQAGFRIYFPTRDTVVNSKGGAKSGGTICLQSRWYNASTFPRGLLHDCKSVRPGIAPPVVKASEISITEFPLSLGADLRFE